MKKFFKIAWRNLWRNKRRTFITISSIFFASFFAIIMRSFQLGTYNHMLNNIVTQFSGHLQVQNVDYFDDPSIDNSIVYNEDIIKKLSDIKQISFFVPRIQTGVLASSGTNSKVAAVMGVDFVKENQISSIEKRIVKYIIDTNVINNIATELPPELVKKIQHYKNKAYTNRSDLSADLSADGIDTAKYLEQIVKASELPNVDLNNIDDEILVGTKLAQYLNLSIGDSLIMIGQGFHGASAVGKFKITGFVKFPTDAFNSRFVYMSLKSCQNFLSAYEINGNDTSFYVNYIVVNTKYQASLQATDYQKIMKVKDEIEKTLNNPEINVVGWKNLNKDLIQGIEIDNGSGKTILGVLYLIIAFGILGTVMMMIAERKREFGVMIAIGMKKSKLSIILSLEMFYMGLLGVISAIIITAPIIIVGHLYPITLHGEISESMGQYNMEPVMPFAWFGSYIPFQVLIVLVLVGISLIYALLKVRKLKVVDSLRS